MNIICFHHAGGDKYSFRPYEKEFASRPGVNVITYDYPGHGDRFNETLIHDAHELADDAFTQLRQYFTKPYSLFGNSMGTLVAYLVLQRIEAAGLTMPAHFYAAARMCPGSYQSRDYGNLDSSEAFWQMIANYGGEHPAIAQPELRELYEPILRADYNALINYRHQLYPPFDIPSTIFWSEGDIYTLNDTRSWQDHFRRPVRYIKIDGDHFFVYSHAREIIPHLDL